MPKIELTILAALALLMFFVIGWISSRIFQNINQIKNLDENEINELNGDLLDAEEERDQTIAYVKSREKELTNQLGQVKAELNAAMDGLGAARREASELRKKLTHEH
jgi:sensor histidine kinase YesM|tara:strand:+ start:112 stop:432 length:321 start_codon:yes stop_codon:yes gene_type:complete